VFVEVVVGGFLGVGMGGGGGGTFSVSMYSSYDYKLASTGLNFLKKRMMKTRPSLFCNSSF